MIVLDGVNLTYWQLPDDHVAARAAFIETFSNPVETWMLAYSFTMPDLVAAIIAAHEAGVPIHLFLDHSQSLTLEAPTDLIALGLRQHEAVAEVVAAGVETTIGTSYAGSKFIAHEKGYATVDADCWEGSTNFSEGAWSQINSAFQFNSPKWRDNLIATFQRAVQYAWTHERGMQLMAAPPPSVTAQG